MGEGQTDRQADRQTDKTRHAVLVQGELALTDKTGWQAYMATGFLVCNGKE